MKLSNLSDYAITLMVEASRHCGGARANAGRLAEATGLPLPTVQKLVSRLSAAGLLRSIRGAGGGLQLARPAAAITVADVVEAVEGLIDTGQRPRIAAAIRHALAEISLTQLVHEPAPETIPEPAPKSAEEYA